jgi:methionyl-tRNA synthetase
MIKSKLDKKTGKEFYNVLSNELFNNDYKLPFGGMIGVLEENKRSTPHSHHETEMFIVIKGNGIISDLNIEEEIECGDIFLSPPFENHYLENKSSEDLIFASFWWENVDNIELGLKAFLNKKQNLQYSKVLVTATPPTPNGDLHVGHLSGPFLNSDIIKRIFELKNVSVKNISGIDDNQNYVLLKANQLGLTADEVSNKFGDLIKDTWKLGNINYDYIINPKDEEYKEFVNEFFITLYNNKQLIEKETEVFYDENGNYIFEAFVKGNCPHCNEISDGLACEQCGMPNNCVDLINPINKIGKILEKRKVKRLFLQTSKFKEQLEQYLDNMDLSYRMSNLKDVFFSELPEIAITHPAAWGINSTIKGYENQVYYVWAEMAAGFLYASKKYEDFSLDNEKNWDGGSSYIQCFGFDNAYFYMFLFPSLYIGYNNKIKLPNKFITNDFLCLEGSKFSTSRNHAIWGNQILNQIDADFLRVYLCKISPVDKESNFVLDSFKYFSSELWGQIFAPWVKNINRKMELFFNNELPSIGSWSKNQILYFDTLNSSYVLAIKHYDVQNYNPSKIVENLFDIINNAYSFSQKENAIYINSNLYNQQRTSINLELNTLFMISTLAYPIMPNFSRYIRESFGFTDNSNELLILSNNLELKEIPYKNLNVDLIFDKINKINSLT